MHHGSRRQRARRGVHPPTPRSPRWSQVSSATRSATGCGFGGSPTERPGARRRGREPRSSVGGGPGWPGDPDRASAPTLCDSSVAEGADEIALDNRLFYGGLGDVPCGKAEDRPRGDPQRARAAGGAAARPTTLVPKGAEGGGLSNMSAGESRPAAACRPPSSERPETSVMKSEKRTAAARGQGAALA